MRKLAFIYNIIFLLLGTNLSAEIIHEFIHIHSDEVEEECIDCINIEKNSNIVLNAENNQFSINHLKLQFSVYVLDKKKVAFFL